MKREKCGLCPSLKVITPAQPWGWVGLTFVRLTLNSLSWITSSAFLAAFNCCACPLLVWRKTACLILQERKESLPWLWTAPSTLLFCVVQAPCKPCPLPSSPSHVCHGLQQGYMMPWKMNNTFCFPPLIPALPLQHWIIFVLTRVVFRTVEINWGIALEWSSWRQVVFYRATCVSIGPLGPRKQS